MKKLPEKRESELQQEVDFYGAMDGASKFVKGDAIAGIIVTIINVIGGIIIGVIVMMDMSFGEAVKNFISYYRRWSCEDCRYQHY